MPTHNETSQSAPLMRGTLRRASMMSKGKDTMTSTGVGTKIFYVTHSY